MNECASSADSDDVFYKLEKEVLGEGRYSTSSKDGGFSGRVHLLSDSSSSYASFPSFPSFPSCSSYSVVFGFLLGSLGFTRVTSAGQCSAGFW